MHIHQPPLLPCLAPELETTKGPKHTRNLLEYNVKAVKFIQLLLSDSKNYMLQNALKSLTKRAVLAIVTAGTIRWLCVHVHNLLATCDTQHFICHL